MKKTFAMTLCVMSLNCAVMANTAFAASTPSAPTLANKEGLDLAKKSMCLACHTVDSKMVGPAFKDVAVRYRGQANAEDQLFKKVLEGGSGSWGSLPMPTNIAVGKENIRALVKWILTLK